jgi:hypothetical protein
VSLARLLEIGDQVGARLRVGHAGKRHPVAAERRRLRLGQELIEQFRGPDEIGPAQRRRIDEIADARGLAAEQALEMRPGFVARRIKRMAGNALLEQCLAALRILRGRRQRRAAVLRAPPCFILE